MQNADLSCFEIPKPIKTLYKYNGMWFDGLTDELIFMLDSEKEQKDLKEKKLKSIIRNLLDDGTIEDIYKLIKNEKKQLEMSHLQKYDYLGKFLDSDETFMITDLKYDGYEFLNPKVSIVSYNNYAYLSPNFKTPFGDLPNTTPINDGFCWQMVRFCPEKAEVYKAFTDAGVIFESKKAKTKKLTNK